MRIEATRRPLVSARALCRPHILSLLYCCDNLPLVYGACKYNAVILHLGALKNSRAVNMVPHMYAVTSNDFVNNKKKTNF